MFLESIKDSMEVIGLIFEILIKLGFFTKNQFYIDRENLRLECAELSRNITSIVDYICPNSIIHNYTVNGDELTCDLHYKGVVRKDDTEGMYFTFSSTNLVEYEKMDCSAILDGRAQRPQLVGPDGLSKKLEVLFNQNMTKETSFTLDFHYNLGSCIIQKKEYILSITKYRKCHFNPYIVNISFVDYNIPSNVRVYELRRGKMRYDKTILPNGNFFHDEIIKNERISVRAYVFDRE